MSHLKVNIDFITTCNDISHEKDKTDTEIFVEI
jgi:hypothetical protein